MTEAQVRAVLGPRLAARASNGPKQLAVTAAGSDDLSPLGLDVGKSLRYGAWLEPTDAVSTSRPAGSSRLPSSFEIAEHSCRRPRRRHASPPLC